MLGDLAGGSGDLAGGSGTFHCSQHSKTLHLCTRSHLGASMATCAPLGCPRALKWAARAPLGCPRALKWAARAPLARPRALKWAALAPLVRSNGPLGHHLGAQGRSNGPLGRHLGAQGRSNGASAPLMRSNRPLGRPAAPLGARPHFESTVRSQSLFEATVRNNRSRKLSRLHCTLLRITLFHFTPRMDILGYTLVLYYIYDHMYNIYIYNIYICIYCVGICLKPLPWVI